jgi:hypothetical protein
MRLLMRFYCEYHAKTNGYQRPYVAKISLNDIGGIDRDIKNLGLYNLDNDTSVVAGYYLAEPGEIIEERGSLGLISWFIISGDCEKRKVVDGYKSEHVKNVKKYLAGKIKAEELYLT